MATVNRPNAPQNYRTPPELLAAVQERFGRITFDAACTREDCVAERGFYYPEVDALRVAWPPGETIWCNPPWRHAGAFARKIYDRRSSGGKVLLLCQAAIDSNWFEQYIHDNCLVLALNPRIPFLNPDGIPAFVDKNGKPLGVNRPAMLCAFNFIVDGKCARGFEPWRWRH